MRKFKRYLLNINMVHYFDNKSFGLDLLKGSSTLNNNKGFINLNFLQKLIWMKAVLDQARFSSLV